MTLFLAKVIAAPGLSMNGMWLHLNMSTHASIYLAMLSLHAQNFIWRV